MAGEEFALKTGLELFNKLFPGLLGSKDEVTTAQAIIYAGERIHEGLVRLAAAVEGMK